MIRRQNEWSKWLPSRNHLSTGETAELPLTNENQTNQENAAEHCEISNELKNLNEENTGSSQKPETSSVGVKSSEAGEKCLLLLVMFPWVTIF